MPQRRSHGHARKREGARDGAPAVERRVVTVYTTLTSPGWAGGELTTIYPSPTSKDEDDTETTTTPDKLVADQKTVGKQVAQLSSSSKSLPSAIEASTALGAMGTGALVAATEDPTTSSTVASSTASSMTPTTAVSQTSSASATSSASSSSTSDGSNDVAVKAGIALGVLGGLLLVLGLVYFLIMKRRKQMEEQQRIAADDEKLNGPFEDGPPPATPAKAPRLSLRPMTGLFTGFNSSASGEQRAVKSPAMAMRAPSASAWDRPMTSESHNDHNPFGSGAERIPEEPSTPHNMVNPMTPISEASTHGASLERAAGLSPAPRAISALTTDSATVPRISAITMDSATVPPILTKNLPASPAGSDEVSPIESADDVPVGQAITTPEPVQAAMFSAKVATAGASLSVMERQPSERRQSVRKENVPAPLDLTLPPKFAAVPPSPADTEFSMHEVDPGQSPIASTSADAIAAAGGPANSTVHRVQLDFKPTLDDEMGLQAGQLVRLLHEYDDGWVSRSLLCSLINPANPW